MAQIVAVHGIGQQLKGRHSLQKDWLPALRDGLSLVGASLSNDSDLKCAFYGDLFRKPGTKSVGEPLYDASDIAEEWEKEMLLAWWYEASKTDNAVVSPDAHTKMRTPQWAQRALNALSYSKFWAGVAERALIFDLKQVYSYLHNRDIRNQACNRVAECIEPDTRVLIAHSLGSVVAYEALCEHPEWAISTFITLGSPLGIRNLIFDKLHPPPHHNVGAWPGSIRHWTNIADKGDIVALVKYLQPLFGERLVDMLVNNEAKAHDVLPYLTAKETGHAVAIGLTAE